MSLLLDALKKAALEKQRREQPGGQAAKPTANSPDTGTPNPQPESIQKSKPAEVKADSVVEQNRVENTPTSESTIAATQIDLGKLNPELEALALVEVETDTAAPSQEDGLVFDINDIDPAYLQADLEPDVNTKSETENASPEFLPGTGVVESPHPDIVEEAGIVEGTGIVEDKGIVEEFVRRASEQQVHNVDLSTDLSLSADEKIALQEVTSQSSTVPAEPTLLESLSPQGQQPISPPVIETAPAVARAEPLQTVPQQSEEKSIEDIKALLDDKAKPVEAFSAVSGKAALAQLLERSKKAANAARKRMMLMYAFLSVTAILMVVFYYYLLHSDSSNLVATVPQAPAAIEASPEETVPEEVATEEVAADGAQQANAISEAPSTEAVVAENSNAQPLDETKAEAGAIKASVTTPKTKVEQPQPGIRKAPKPAQDSATHQVLPPASVPKQAMLVERNAPVDAVSEAIDRGYKAYQRGDISAANEAYQEALQQDPYQRDAMLGAAAVAVRQGRQEDALNIYQQRLARAPKDQYAQSGILALSEATDNAELDSELNRLLQQYPDAAHLHFLKGSLYAARQQWAAAQVSFFEAWQRDNKNPDLAFNLAVALDHLAQPKEAARFYRQSLTLGANRPASFSVEAIQRRLQDLEGANSGDTSREDTGDEGNGHEGPSHEGPGHGGPSHEGANP